MSRNKKSKKTLEIIISCFLFLIFLLYFLSASQVSGVPLAVPLVLFALSAFYLLYCLNARAEYFRQEAGKEDVKLNIVDVASAAKDAPKDLGIIYSYLGGSGYSFHESEKVHLLIMPEGLRISLVANGTSVDIPFTEIHEIEISGPGTTTSNASISGGGFGLEGFVKGAVAAALINAATTKSSTNTFARMLTTTGELYLHTSQAEPAQLKIGLSQVFVSIANKIHNSSSSNMHGAVAEEITKLHKLKQDGLIDDDEYKAAKSKLLGISV